MRQIMSDAKRLETLLIIDDTPDNLRFLSDLLGRAGYAVRKVISGELGLEAAQLEPPDLILLDIKMPGLDGYQVCDQLKSSHQTRAIPVIFLSAMSEELDKVMAFEAGCVDYITKPFQMVEVLARIENQLQVSRLRQALERQNQQLQATIAQRASAETALETLNQELERQVQARTTALQASLDQALQQSITLPPAAVEALLTALKILIASAARLDSADLTAQPAQQIASSARSIQQILAQILPVRPLRAADLTQFCQRFLSQWPLPDRPQYQLVVVGWGKPLGELSLDANSFRQTLSQILADALLNSPQGGSVLLQLTYQPRQVQIEIRDQGIGSPPDEIDWICKQVDQDSDTKAMAGQAGLLIAQQIVVSAGGSLGLSSQPGQGRTVTVVLPLTLS